MYTRNIRNNAMLTIALILNFLLLSHMTESSIAQYNATDYFLINCGSQSNSTDSSDGRVWSTDTHHPYFLPSIFSRVTTAAKASEQDPSVPEIPYMTARVIKSKFTYSFPVSPGPKFLRLYFYPATYSGFNKSQSYFSVTANNFTLLSNFSAFLAVSASADKSSNNGHYIRKEYVINVDEPQRLNITFSPSQGSYAFVNGIEIVSMPTNLYIRGDYPIKFMGQNNLFYLDNSTAYETMYRFNMGGSLVPSTGDTGMYREWNRDDNFVLEGGYVPTPLDVHINYTAETPAYTAPEIVYITSRTMGNYSESLTWSFPLHSGFFYLFRLHFCEFQTEFQKENDRVFDISFGNQTAEHKFDVIEVSGGWRRPVYSDYVVSVRDADGKKTKQNVLLDLRPTHVSNMERHPVYATAILNGLEIFKLSDSLGNLAEPSFQPSFQLQAPIISPSSISNNRSKKSWHIIVFIIAGVIGGISISVLVIFQGLKKGKHSDTTVTKLLPLLPSNLCQHFLLEEIRKATRNFDDNLVIGHGGFGNVYKGYLDNGTTMVAVKRLHPSSKQGVCEFQTEIEMLSKLRHLHLVSLIGYCDDNDEMILVYDYMAHGTLRDHLYKTDNAPLSWKKRLEICIGAAKGLYYLHLHTGTKHTIIHRDVKSTNILLDDKWVAKVSDFGLSKVSPLGETDNTHISTAVKGSFGYLDPEYFKRQQLTEKSDVYSFGVVLFEVLCARPAIMPNLPEHEQVNLADWACRCYEQGNVDRIIDPNLEGQIAPECLSKFAQVAYSCLRDQGVQRPSMGDVVWTLELSLRLQDAAHSGGHTVEGCSSYPASSSFPLTVNDQANISTNQNEIVSGSGYTSIFSETLNPLGR